MNIVMESEAIHEAFEELRTMRVIANEAVGNDDDEEGMLRIDRTRLSKLGYTLVLGDNLAPTFVRLFDLQYMYNPILYMSDRVPRSALRTYVVSKIKNDCISG